MELKEFIDKLPEEEAVVHEVVYKSWGKCKALVSRPEVGSIVNEVDLDCSQGRAAKALGLPLDNFYERFLRVTGLLRIRLFWYSIKSKYNYNKKQKKKGKGNGFQ